MPTDNPKISLYVPQVIYDRFKEFQEERKLSMSQAGIVILAEYFELTQIIERTTEGIVVGGVSFGWVKSLEEQIIKLQEEVEQLKSTSKPLIEKQDESQQHTEIIDISKEEEKNNNLVNNLTIESKQDDRLDHEKEWTPAELARRLNINPSIISRKKFKEDFIEWTREKDPDNIGWITLKSGKLKPEKIIITSVNKTQYNISVKDINTEQNIVEIAKSSQLSLLSKPLNKVNLVSGYLLAKRLNAPKYTCANKKRTLSREKFYEWSKQRDFDEVGWIPNPNGHGYVPGDELDDELLSKLQKWIEKNA